VIGDRVHPPFRRGETAHRHARALYSDPALLILDEANRRLDNQTERTIVDSILALSPAKTIVIIAHRLSWLNICDQVHLMNSGQIIDVGTFDEIAMRIPISSIHNQRSPGIPRDA